MSQDAVEALLRRLEQDGLALEAQAVRLVRQMYGRLNLADLFVLINELSGRDMQLASSDKQQLKEAFEQAANAMKAQPEAFSELLREAVLQGVSGGTELMAAQGMALNAFRGTPDIQVGYLERSLTRFRGYWFLERARFSEEVQRVLITGINRGVGPDQVATLLRQRVEVSRSRALLIVTNEMGNAHAHAQQETLKELGVQRYRWRTSQDSRVRSSHIQRNGKIYSWDTPPPDGHPGEPIRCRCVALGVVPGEVARDEFAPSNTE